MPTVSLVVNVWFGMVSIKLPVCEIYCASVAVNPWLAAPENAVFLIDPIPELTNLCSYAWSVTPIATDPPRYPEPKLRSSKNSYASPPPT